MPSLDAGDRLLLDLHAQRFNARDFEGVRAQLSEEVRLDVVGREKLQGKVEVAGYMGRDDTADDWRFVAGLVAGQPGLMVIDPRDAVPTPRYVVLLRLEQAQVTSIRDFRYARYATEVIDWATVYPPRREAPRSVQSAAVPHRP